MATDNPTQPTKLQALLAKNVREQMSLRPHLNTQVKLSTKAGVTQSTVGRILRGEVSPLLSNVEAVADALGVSVTSLLVEPHERDEIQYDREAYARLPESEKEKIQSYIAFVIATNKGLTFSEVTPADPAQADMLAAASSRPLDHRTLTHNETTSSPKKRAVKRS
ncbi:LexA family transcriptional repressor [Pandoraea eparura]|uniref:LexA family transcriptional repressor n=2 Tax=Pandoraea eparura TaxID=2508291 RepID=A0A5E4SNZ9_9BURK|nr:LexA family transcriptional repressor [Pandoraea eparura]